MKMQIIFLLLLLMGLNGVLKAEDPLEVATPNFVDEEQITIQAQNVLRQPLILRPKGPVMSNVRLAS